MMRIELRVSERNVAMDVSDMDKSADTAYIEVRQTLVNVNLSCNFAHIHAKTKRKDAFTAPCRESYMVSVSLVDSFENSFVEPSAFTLGSEERTGLRFASPWA